MPAGTAMAKILVVDDEPQWIAANRKLLEKQLGSFNITETATI